MKIAIIGTGISGMVTAYHLTQDHQVTVFESNSYIGGHTNTVDIQETGQHLQVDTGFIVFNQENYPNFTRLIQELGVESELSNMSFSVTCDSSGLQYSGTSINSLFAQRRNLVRPEFLRMVKDLIKFYRQSAKHLESADYNLTLSEYLSEHGYSETFIKHHILPLGAAIWSSGTESIENFPARYFVEFFRNHGFLKFINRPQWRFIKGGSRNYVEQLTSSFSDDIRLNCPVREISRKSESVEINHPYGKESFDYVIIGTHSDQALRLLSDPSPKEFEILNDIKYEKNETVLHSDSSLIPSNPLVRSSWNYAIQKDQPDRPIVTYYMNRLQNLRSETDYCVTLNRTDRINPNRILKKIVYEHPVFNSDAIFAQQRKHEISGSNRTLFCGAYWGYGFHEDGVVSGLEACETLDRLLGEENEKRTLRGKDPAPAIQTQESQFPVQPFYGVSRPGRTG